MIAALRNAFAIKTKLKIVNYMYQYNKKMFYDDYKEQLKTQRKQNSLIGLQMAYKQLKNSEKKSDE